MTPSTHNVRSTLVRFAFAVGLFLLITGPAPGYIGGCNLSKDDAPADAIKFCVDRHRARCLRAASAMAQGCPGAMAVDYNACLAMVDCEGRYFPCQATKAATDRCIHTLYVQDNICIPEADLHDCDLSTLCGGTYVPPSDAGTPETDAGMTPADAGRQVDGGSR